MVPAVAIRSEQKKYNKQEKKKYFSERLTVQVQRLEWSVARSETLSAVDMVK